MFRLAATTGEGASRWAITAWGVELVEHDDGREGTADDDVTVRGSRCTVPTSQVHLPLAVPLWYPPKRGCEDVATERVATIMQQRQHLVSRYVMRYVKTVKTKKPVVWGWFLTLY